MPGPPPVELGPRDRRRLEAAVRELGDLERRYLEASRRFAALVRELGVSACARSLGVSRQALRARVVRIERRDSPKIPPRGGRAGVEGRQERH